MNFDVLLESPVPAPRPRFRTVAEMLEGDGVVLASPDRTVTLADLRAAANRARAWMREAGHGRDESVVLFREPGAPELPIAVAMLAFLANGVRVVLPMTVDPRLNRLGRAVSMDELRPLEPAPFVAPREVDPDAEALVLTTSGTSGEPKPVAYTQTALLTCAEAWQAAGLLDESTTGGPSVCPLLSHSMGVRNVLHAVWNRRPTLLVPPEWLDEAPHRIADALVRHPPAHLTCGPALLRGVAEMARQFPEMPEFRCLVSSGAPFDPGLRKLWPRARLANAFGMTETQQVTNTLLGGSDESLGRPLPGVSLGVRFVEGRVGRLFVRTPFGAVRGWFDTGDLVRWTGEDLLHVGRAESDFLKNGFGLKLPLDELRRRYGDFEYFSFSEQDGAAAVAFVGERDPAAAAREIRATIESRTETDLLVPRLRAVGCVRGSPPRRGPGKVDRDRIRREHPALFDALAGRAKHTDVETIEPRDSYQPRITALLQALGLDREYVSGSGDELDDVLDLAGGYGANLLGHSHPEILRTAEEALRRVPLLDQMAKRLPAERLARELSRLVGRKCVAHFASSGSEAVGLALLHATMERRPSGRPAVLALEGGYHGRFPDGIDVVRVPIGADPPRIDNLVAVLVEPILGEGGFVEVPLDWIEKLRVPGVPLILDEIQCGLGRSGSFLASEGVRGDYVLLGKALGGGVAKIAALLVDRERHVEEFEEMAASTFAADAFSCTVALKVLEILERDDVPRRAREAGRRLQAAIPGVRGRGLMLGVELAYRNDPPCSILQALADRGLGWLAASYLLRRHRIRTLPATSAPNVLRIQPSAWFDRTERVAGAIAALRSALDRSDLAELVARPVPAEPKFRLPHDPPSGRKIAFLHHPIHAEEEMLGDAPGLAGLPLVERRELVGRFQTLLELHPFVSFSRSLFGGRLWMAGITLPATPAALERVRRSLVRRRIQEAVDLAASIGCTVATLGAQTSILSVNGTALRAPAGLRLCTGNTLTAAIALEQIAGATGPVGIVGAAGNIGRAMAALVDDPLLVGRPGSEARLESLGRGRVSTNLDDLRSCGVIVLATSASEPVLLPRHVAADRSVLIADLAQPPACSPSVPVERPNAKLLAAGLVRLPEDPDFAMSTHTPPGVAFACAAEAMLVALEDAELELTGDVRPENVRRLAEMARRWSMTAT